VDIFTKICYIYAESSIPFDVVNSLKNTKAEMMISIFIQLSIALALAIAVVFPVSFLWTSLLFSLFLCSFVVDAFTNLYRYVDRKTIIQKLE